MRKIALLLLLMTVNTLLYYAVLGPWGYYLFDGYRTINEETAYRDGLITMTIGNLLIALPITLILSIFIHRVHKYGKRFSKLFIPSIIGVQVVWILIQFHTGYLNYIGDYPPLPSELTEEEIEYYLDQKKQEVVSLFDSAVYFQKSDLFQSEIDSLTDTYRNRANELLNEVTEFSEKNNIPLDRYESFQEELMSSKAIEELRELVNTKSNN